MLDIVVAIGRAHEEARGIAGKAGLQRLGDRLGEVIGAQIGPDAEEIAPARGQHPPGLAEALNPVGEEHDAELAGHHVEAGIGEGQGLAVRRAPGHMPGRELRDGEVQHGLVEVGGGDRRRRQGRGQRPGHDTGAGGDLQQPAGGQGLGAGRQILGIGLEEQRDHVALIERGNRAGEGPVVLLRHRKLPLCCGALGRGAADRQPVDLQGRLADAHRHALAFLAAGADARIELHVVAHHARPWSARRARCRSGSRP